MSALALALALACTLSYRSSNTSFALPIAIDGRLEHLEVCRQRTVGAAVRRFCSDHRMHCTTSFVMAVASAVGVHMTQAGLWCTHNIMLT